MARKTVTTPGRVGECHGAHRDPNKYDLSVLLALNPIKVYESIIPSGIAGTEYGRLPWLALSVMSGHTSNAASKGCHSIAQLIMSDLQTSMGDDIVSPGRQGGC